MIRFSPEASEALKELQEKYGDPYVRVKEQRICAG